MKKPAIVFFLCLGSAIVSGQETDPKEMSAVKVTVIEAGNGEPVQMATVYIVPATRNHSRTSHPPNM